MATVLAEEREAKLELVAKVDRTKLSAIRHAALETQHKLIVEEEGPEFSGEAPLPVVAFQKAPLPEAPLNSEESASKGEGQLLTLQEEEYLRLLLSDPSAKLSGGVSSELLADAINEKLYDLFSDTVLIFEADHFIILEDYRKKIEELLAS